VLIVSETAWLQAQGQFGIAVFFAILLLGVLVFIVTGCWVVFPAMVIERIGPVAAILRSWRLTRGRRWHILALLVLLVAIEWAISYLFIFEIKITLIGSYATLVLNVPLSFFATVVLTTSYYNLVGEKDGVTALGRIFV
jgi:fucose 4-O-acetylase-like acetyltransferase